MDLPTLARRQFWRSTNLLERALLGPLTPEVRAPREVVFQWGKVRLFHYESAGKTKNVPVLIVPPLGANPMIFDLRAGHSLIGYLVECGLDVFMLDYGVPDKVEAKKSVLEYATPRRPPRRRARPGRDRIGAGLDGRLEPGRGLHLPLLGVALQGRVRREPGDAGFAGRLFEDVPVQHHRQAEQERGGTGAGPDRQPSGADRQQRLQAAQPAGFGAPPGQPVEELLGTASTSPATSRSPSGRAAFCRTRRSLYGSSRPTSSPTTS